MKRRPGRPRKKPPAIEEIFEVFSELVDKKIELAIAELEDYFKEIVVEVVGEHRKRYHPFCDPKELDHVLKLLREEFERRKHGQL